MNISPTTLRPSTGPGRPAAQPLSPRRVLVGGQARALVLQTPADPQASAPVQQPPRRPAPPCVESHVRLRDRKAQPGATTQLLVALGLGFLVMTGLRGFIAEDDPDDHMLPRLIAGLASALVFRAVLRTGQQCRDELAERRERAALAERGTDGPGQLARLLDEACKSPLNAHGVQRAVDRLLHLHNVHPRTVPGASVLSAMAKLATQAIAIPGSDTGPEADEWFEELAVIKQGIDELAASRGAKRRECRTALQALETTLARRLPVTRPSLKRRLSSFMAAPASPMG